MMPPLASSGPELDAAQVAGTGAVAPVQERPCLLGSLRLALSVDVVPQELKLGSVSLHRVQSERTHESRAMNALPSRASATANLSLGSCSSTWTTDRRLPPCPASRAAWSRTSGIGG